MEQRKVKLVLSTEELAYRRSYLEAMRNMASVVAYSFASGFLIFRQPEILGSTWISTIFGLILLLITSIGAMHTTELFLQALIERFGWITRHKAIAAAVVLPIFLVMGIMAPWVVAFELTSK